MAGSVPDSAMGNLSGVCMGIGKLGGDDIIHKRKFRWLMSIDTCAGTVPPHYVKMSSRPDLTIEETEINFLNEKTWVPGKAAWETITVTYYDVAASDNGTGILLSWLASVYNFKDTCRYMATKRKDYKGVVDINLLDGCGNSLEWWTLDDAWPTSIKFGELDMSSSDVCEIELTLRYSQVTYNAFCPPGQVNPCACSSCG